MTTDVPAPDDLEEVQLRDDELVDLSEADPDIERVSYSGTDFDVEGLVRRLIRGDVVIPNFGHDTTTLESAAFQRGFVWTKPQMDKFVESLLLGYPIPGIMLVLQADKRYLVLDGQQRLTTLRLFYDGIYDGKEFTLQNVAQDFKGLTYRNLPVDLRRTLDDTFIQATIVKTDGSKDSYEAIYQVFERLNSGGTQLTAHEIRIALYPGPFVDVLAQLNAEPNWRRIYGPPSPRLRDHELLLRIFAFYTRANEYKRPLKKFLNDFMSDHRDLTRLDIDHLKRLFFKSVEVLADADGRRHFRPTGRLNASLLEAVFVAAMKRANSGGELELDPVAAALESLTENGQMLGAISGSTAAEDNLNLRLQLADEAFAGV